VRLIACLLSTAARASTPNGTLIAGRPAVDSVRGIYSRICPPFLRSTTLVWQDSLPREVQSLYEIRDYHHAATILAHEFRGEFQDVCSASKEFRITTADIVAKGGNESAIPKKFSAILRPLGWKEEKLQANLMVDNKTISSDTHRIDYVKSGVALDVEWNSKDQTLDRDLYAFRTFFEFGKISVAVLITRSEPV
jgi:CRISPR-associated protein Csd2